MQETQDVESISGLGRFPGIGMAPHSSVLIWKISWTREAWQAIVHGVTVLDMTEQTSKMYIKRMGVVVFQHNINTKIISKLALA